jgi:formylglycine-generating enzyme required for sulfatase activity
MGKRYPNGDKLTGKDANHSLNHVGPRPVKSYPPNGFGLYEMAGNVWEWVWDWYAGDLSALTDDPRGPLSGERRVIRGGGSSGSPDSCGVAVRVSMRGDVSLNTGGFRVVRRFKQSEAR